MKLIKFWNLLINNPHLKRTTLNILITCQVSHRRPLQLRRICCGNLICITRALYSTRISSSLSTPTTSTHAHTKQFVHDISLVISFLTFLEATHISTALRGETHAVLNLPLSIRYYEDASESLNQK